MKKTIYLREEDIFLAIKEIRDDTVYYYEKGKLENKIPNLIKYYITNKKATCLYLGKNKYVWGFQCNFLSLQKIRKEFSEIDKFVKVEFDKEHIKVFDY